MKYTIPFTPFVVLGLCLCLVANAQNKKVRQNAKPVAVVSGADSHVKKPLYLRVSTPNELTRAWANHLGPEWDHNYGTQLEVDFDRYLVVVIFRGEQINVRGIQVRELLTTANSVVIRFDEIGYQTGRNANDKSPEVPPDRPYAFVVMPKTDKSIAMEENVQEYKGKPPQWKECARLEVVSPEDR